MEVVLRYGGKGYAFKIEVDYLYLLSHNKWKFIETFCNFFHADCQTFYMHESLKVALWLQYSK
jgi:hypothetical protein